MGQPSLQVNTFPHISLVSPWRSGPNSRPWVGWGSRGANQLTPQNTLRLRGEELGFESHLPLICLPVSGPLAEPARSHPPTPVPFNRSSPFTSEGQSGETGSLGSGLKSCFYLISSKPTALCQVKSQPV